MNPASLLICTALVLTAFQPGTAAVFTRIPKTPELALEQLGGRSLQRSSVEVNGLPGSMTVFGFDQAAQSLCGALAATLDRPELAQAGAAGSLWLEWPSQDRNPAQVFVLPGEAGRSLAIVVEIPSGAKDSAPAWPWRDLAVPPGFHAAFSAAQDGGRVALVTGTLALPPEASRRALAQHLLAEGWAPASPAADTVSSAIYAKELETLVTTVLTAQDGAGGSRAVILRRRTR